MRKSAISAAAVLSSVALLSVGAPTVSQAATSFTQKELTICWVNETHDAVQDLEIVADGPSYKSFSLDAGECISWDVQPGQYKITVEDMDEFLDALDADDNHDGGSFQNCSGDNEPHFSVTIRRMNDTYKAFTEAALEHGEVVTNVKKNRSTAVTIALKCIDDPA